LEPAEGDEPAVPGDFLQRSYYASLLAKGLLGGSQLAAGLALALTPRGGLARLAHWLAASELAADPTDGFARLVQSVVAVTPLADNAFYPIYLIVHGVLNLGFVLALVARFAWAYPASIMALLAFIAYQLYNFAMGSQPILMLVLSAIDAIVVALIWREYRRLRPAPDL